MARILIATPTYNKVEPSTMSKVLQILGSTKDVGFVWEAGYPIDHVRNRLVKKVLDTMPDVSHVLFLDDDVDPPAKIIDMLLSCQSDIAAAIVPIYVDGVIHTNIQVYEHGKKIWLSTWGDKDEPFDIANAGTGCMLVRTDVFRQMAWPWFKWDQETQDAEPVGEDIYFTDKAKAAGLSMKTHPQSMCGHYKKMNLLDLIMAINRR